MTKLEQMMGRPKEQQESWGAYGTADKSQTKNEQIVHSAE